jgi:hypothetical protein
MKFPFTSLYIARNPVAHRSQRERGSEITQTATFLAAEQQAHTQAHIEAHTKTSSANEATFLNN